MSIVSKLLNFVAKRLPVRLINGGAGTPYLYKYLLWRSSDDKDSWRLHLHRFVRSEEDRELHNHPWRIAVAVILSGGYVEELRVSKSIERTNALGQTTKQTWHEVVKQAFWPGAVNVIWPDTFHRVDLLARESWSLILSGPITQSWGFWSRETKEFIGHREFFAKKGLQAVTGEYWKEQWRGAPWSKAAEAAKRDRSTNS